MYLNKDEAAKLADSRDKLYNVGNSASINIIYIYIYIKDDSKR